MTVTVDLNEYVIEYNVHLKILPVNNIYMYFQGAESVPVTAGTNDLQFQMIKLISVLTRFEEAWLSQHAVIVSVRAR